MSSLRNAVKRVTHKERSQPQSRTHLGILEKKKDYTLRARDYHKKQDRVQVLRRKAATRNPDEFYFGMNRAGIKEGVHRKLEEVRQKEMEDTIGADAVKIMKGQDLSYVRLQLQKDARKIEKMQASLHFLDNYEEVGKKRRHTVFVESKEKADNFDVAEHFDTFPELAARSFNRPRRAMLKTAVCDNSDGGDSIGEKYVPTEKEQAKQAKVAKRAAKKIARARATAYREMEARASRKASMEIAEAHLITEKLLAAKGKKRKIKAAEDGKPAVYKW
eukprot:CAMPEP_0113552122 /NCGR_PEP_ID=MMETSP0015_2-20120614/14894_1 /TAXON_ID=2838 /ORGANISM="Odontella" /LENGTH=274 /DNA_ID=CAMNT_0000453069 /DNA_START=370 /DNA_END=1191 /DNA_ORIENTATION=+ /assembly_acc=CAM_ASM_000160